MAQFSFVPAAKLIELLKNTSPDTHVRVLTRDQLAVGADPFNPTEIIDLSLEVIRPVTSGGAANVEAEPARTPPAPTSRLSRQTGRYLLDVQGQTIECRSLKELLAEGLKGLEKHRSGTLDQLSGIKPRTKRIVARDAAQLFDHPELAEKYAEKLTDDWWFGTNNSADETIAWLRRGSELAGLQWGRDISTSL